MPAAALQERLDDQRRDFMVLRRRSSFEYAGQLLEIVVAGLVGRNAGFGNRYVPRGRQANNVEQQGFEHLVEAGHAAHAHSAQRIAVVSVGKGNVLRLFGARFIALPPVLKGHLQRHFDRAGAVAGEENVREALRGDVDQPLGEFDRGRIRHAQQRSDMRDFVDLLAQRGIEPRVAVTVHVAPHAAHAVEIFATVDIEQP